MGMGLSGVYTQADDATLKDIEDKLRLATDIPLTVEWIVPNLSEMPITVEFWSNIHDCSVGTFATTYGVWDYASIDLGDDPPEPAQPELIECSDGKFRTLEAKSEWEAHIWEQLKLAVGT